MGERHVISGRVLDSRGRVPHDLVVMVSIPLADGFGSAFPTPIGHDGSFVTRPLPPGTYALEARAPFGVPTGTASEGAFTLVTVNRWDVRDVMYGAAWEARAAVAAAEADAISQEC